MHLLLPRDVVQRRAWFSESSEVDLPKSDSSQKKDHNQSISSPSLYKHENLSTYRLPLRLCARQSAALVLLATQRKQ